MIKITGISKYIANKILNFILGRQSFAVPDKYYLAISTTPLGDDGIGLSEPLTTSGYTRLILPNDKTCFSSSLNKIVSIKNEYVYPEATQNWGKCTHFSIFDSNTGGNVLWYGALQNSRDVEKESSLIIEPNTNQFCIDVCNDANGDGVCDGSTTDMAITTYAADKIANHLFGRSPVLVPPDKYYVGISTTPLSTEGIGMTEPSGGGYTRLELPNDKNTFSLSTNKSVTLTKQFKFANAEIPWGNIKYYFISDAKTGGNVWWTGKLILSRNVEIATTLVIRPNGFIWKLDNCNHLDTAPSSAILMSLSNMNSFWG